MKFSILYKIASVLLVLFAVIHTFGLFHPAAGSRILDTVTFAMQNVHFEITGFERTYWDFYVGFGLLFTVFLLFSAALSWVLGGMQNFSVPARLIAWLFALAHIAVAVLCWTNFFLAAAVGSSLIAVCLLIAAWQVQPVG